MSLTFDPDEHGAVGAALGVGGHTAVVGPVGVVHVLNAQGGILYVFVVREGDPAVGHVEG